MRSLALRGAAASAVGAAPSSESDAAGDCVARFDTSDTSAREPPDDGSPPQGDEAAEGNGGAEAGSW